MAGESPPSGHPGTTSRGTVPGARRRARDLMLVPRTADRRSVFLEHRREHLPAGGDGELQQRRARIDEQIDERQLALGLGITLVGLIDCARRSLPGGSFLAGLRPGLVTTRVSRAVRSRRSHISTAVGTSPGWLISKVQFKWRPPWI